MAMKPVQRWLDTVTSDIKRCLHALSARWGATRNGSSVRAPACYSRACPLSRRACFRGLVLLLWVWVLGALFHYNVFPGATQYYHDDCLMTEERRERMRFLLRHVVQFLNEEKVTYWLDYGTLLGVIREGDIIPHDSDLDVSRVADDPVEDEKLMSRFKDKMKPLGIIYSKTHVDGASYEGVNLDMFRWKSFNASSGKTLLRKIYEFYRPDTVPEKISNYLFPTETDPKILFPLRNITVFGVTVKIPNKILDFLKSRYPLTWSYSSVPYKWKCYVGT